MLPLSLSFLPSQILAASVSGPPEIFVSAHDDSPAVFRSEDEARVEFRDEVAESGERPVKMATRILKRAVRFSWALLERGRVVLSTRLGGGRRSRREMRCRTAAGILALRRYACLFGGGSSRYFGNHLTHPEAKARRKPAYRTDRSRSFSSLSRVFSCLVPSV